MDQRPLRRRPRVPERRRLRLGRRLSRTAALRRIHPGGLGATGRRDLRRSRGRQGIGRRRPVRHRYRIERRRVCRSLHRRRPGSKSAVGGNEIRQYEWVHLAATWDGAKIRLYVDGELAATRTATTPPGTGEGDLRIGCDTPSGPFGGRIDEVRVYRRTLNAGEVAADMETAMQTPKATPIAKYSFDESNEE